MTITTITKDIRGSWRAEDKFDLTVLRVLTITTSKVHNGDLVTRATVSTRDGSFLSHVMFQDFSQCMKASKVRCTSKAVAAQHGEAVSKLDELCESVAAHYAKESA